MNSTAISVFFHLMRSALVGVLLALASTEALAQDAPTQIHLAYGANPQAQMVVVWRTAVDAASDVQYGPTGALGTTVSGTSAPSPNGAVGFIHTATVTGLAADSLYYYSCGSAAGGWSATLTFRTASATARPFVIATAGDFGTSATVTTVMTLMASKSPDLFLPAGDLSYANGGSQAIWDTWFDLMQPVAQRAPMMAAIGNHELQGNDLQSYLGRFALPGDERTYSFRTANIHIAMVDTNQSVVPGSAQHAWLAADLAAATADPAVRWKIVVFHHPPYSSGTVHSSDANVRRLVPLLDAMHVDVVISGHEHTYERTVALRNSVADAAGTMYALVGTGGRPSTAFLPFTPAWSAARYAIHGFGLISIDGDTLQFDMVRGDDVIVDTFTLTKTVDVTDPSVTLPAAGGWTLSTSVPFAANAVDNEGVVSVEFSIDGVIVSTDTVFPFEITGIPAGNHLVSVRAVDAAGNDAVASRLYTFAATAADIVVPQATAWKYRDAPTAPPAGWNTAAYDDTAWTSGPAVLGYGEPYVVTTISYGPDANDKYPAAHFRRTFTVDDETKVARLIARFRVDDGYVAYLNGVEVARGNMILEQPVDETTLAENVIDAGGFVDVDLSAFVTLLVPGTNVLAIEVHQATIDSSDFVFDAELEVHLPVPADPTPPGDSSGKKKCGLLGIEAVICFGILAAVRRLAR